MPRPPSGPRYPLQPPATENLFKEWRDPMTPNYRMDSLNYCYNFFFDWNSNYMQFYNTDKNEFVTAEEVPTNFCHAVTKRVQRLWKYVPTSIDYPMMDICLRHAADELLVDKFEAQLGYQIINNCYPRFVSKFNEQGYYVHSLKQSTLLPMVHYYMEMYGKTVIELNRIVQGFPHMEKSIFYHQMLMQHIWYEDVVENHVRPLVPTGMTELPEPKEPIGFIRTQKTSGQTCASERSANDVPTSPNSESSPPNNGMISALSSTKPLSLDDLLAPNRFGCF